MGSGNKIMVGMVVKANIGELEAEAMKGFLRRIRKELTGVAQLISAKKRFLERFQYVWERDMNSNKITIVIVEKIPAEEEPEVPMNTEIPEEKLTLEEGYYNGVYVTLIFKKEVGVDRKEDQADV